jgi:hypothetical protein
MPTLQDDESTQRQSLRPADDATEKQMQAVQDAARVCMSVAAPETFQALRSALARMHKRHGIGGASRKQLASLRTSRGV